MESTRLSECDVMSSMEDVASAEEDGGGEEPIGRGNSFTENANSIKEALSSGAHQVVDVTGTGIRKVMTTTSDLLVGAAKYTPGMKNTVQPAVHRLVLYIFSVYLRKYIICYLQ
jgi:hypothetical protein